MYSNSRRTRILVFSRWMTALDMYFMATLCPVIVCVATEKKNPGFRQVVEKKIGYGWRTFDLPERPFCNILDDRVLPELGRGVLRWNITHFGYGLAEQEARDGGVGYNLYVALFGPSSNYRPSG